MCCTKEQGSPEEGRHIGFELHRLMRTIARCHLATPASQTAEQLTKRHGYLLRYLFENDAKSIYQRDIEREFSLSRSAVTTSLQAMEKNGLIIREGVDGDARLKRIRLTPKARDLHLQIEREIDDFETRLTAGLTLEEREQFLRLIGKLRENIEEPRK